MTQSRRTYQRRPARGSGRGQAKPKPDSYQLISDRFIAALEEGRRPWQEPWTTGGLPKSAATGKSYRGLNTLLLWMTSAERGYASPWWCTARQANALGGHVRKGQTAENGCGATWITKWGDFTRRDAEPDPETGEKLKSRYLKVYPVFNSEQVDGLPDRFYPEHGDIERAERPEAVLAAYQATGTAPEIRHDVHGEAYYSPRADVIRLPEPGEHISTAEYYSTLFHELGHATGHPDRLARPGIKIAEPRTKHEYGEEELVAEIAASMMCSESGVQTPDSQENSEAYVVGWAQQIRADKRLVVHAAAQAQKAADVVLDPSREPQPESDADADADADDDAGGIEAA
jgi:antirestriction protein ArdC